MEVSFSMALGFCHLHHRLGWYRQAGWLGTLHVTFYEKKVVKVAMVFRVSILCIANML